MRREADVESRKRRTTLPRWNGARWNEEKEAGRERERCRGRRVYREWGWGHNSLGREAERTAKRGCRERPEGLVFIASPVDVVVVGVVAVVVVVDNLDSLVKFSERRGAPSLLSLCLPPSRPLAPLAVTLLKEFPMIRMSISIRRALNSAYMCLRTRIIPLTSRICPDAR